MNVFLTGYRATGRVDGSRASAAFDRWRLAYRDFDAAPVGSWESPTGDFVAYWASHAALTGTPYAADDGERFATFAGRPYLWSGDDADGRGALDARAYLGGLGTLRDRLDGRTAIVRYAAGEMTVYTDAHGTQPTYTATTDGVTWVSTNAPLLYAVAGRGQARRHVLSCYFAFGWAIGGEPLWEPVDRLPKGTFLTVSPAGTTVDVDPAARLGPLLGQGWDPKAAVALLAQATGALADWPGRPNLIAVTGGRDSRVVVAAAKRAGVEFAAVTHAFPDEPGFPATGDSTVGREVCHALGVSHETTYGNADDVEYTDPKRALEALAFTSPGTLDLEDARGLWAPLPGEPHAVLMSGVGGEFARSVYGHTRGVPRGSLAKLLYRQVVKAWLQPPLLNEAGRDDVMRCLAAFVDRHLDEGVQPDDVGDTFFAEQLSAREATKSLAYDYREEAVSPFLSRRLLPHQVGVPQPEREQDIFHLEMLRELAPELIDIPFAGDKPGWPSLQSEEERRDEHLRRVEKQRSASAVPDAPDDIRATVRRLTREAVASQPAHEAWEVLDRAAVERVVDEGSGAVGKQAGFQLWWLATMFLREHG
ncbi:MAG TPA: hypothetical protein VF230_03255 [Acidimicrobiales bacterium]